MKSSKNTSVEEQTRIEKLPDTCDNFDTAAWRRINDLSDAIRKTCKAEDRGYNDIHLMYIKLWAKEIVIQCDTIERLMA